MNIHNQAKSGIAYQLPESIKVERLAELTREHTLFCSSCGLEIPVFVPLESSNLISTTVHFHCLVCTCKITREREPGYSFGKYIKFAALGD